MILAGDTVAVTVTSHKSLYCAMLLGAEMAYSILHQFLLLKPSVRQFMPQ